MNVVLHHDSGLTPFQIAFLTHTSPQLYRRDIWENSVMKVDREVRALALMQLSVC